MSTTNMLIEKLPLELLDHVISLVDTLKDLAQCRLVCKFLDPLAQRAMFGKPIIVSSVSAANALRYHLENNQEMCKLIRSVNIKNDKDAKADEYIKLLPWVFTPAIESFEGYIKSPEFFIKLVDIAEASGDSATFHRLKVIPQPAYNCMDEYYKAILCLKKTLQHVHIHYQYTTDIPWHVFDQLGEFANLTSLEIDGGVETVQELNRMLAPCTRLRELNTQAYEMMQDAMKEKDLLDWMEQHVEQVDTLTKVEIQGAQQPDIIEFLVYKYPNMAEASVYLGSSEYYEERVHYNYNPIWVEEPATEQIHRIIDALQSVPVFRFYYMAAILPTILEEIEDHVEAYDPLEVSYQKKGHWMVMEVITADDAISD